MIYKEGMLAGKVALVTGANRGLGYAMCVGLAENGADIFNIGHGDDTNIREAIEKLGRRYHYMKADLSKPTKALTDEIVAEVVNVYGHLDILLNNAGVNRRAPFLEYADEHGLACYLDCYTERLEQLYGHFGFETVERRSIDAFPIEERLMVRRAR